MTRREARGFIEAHKWKFAKTMPEHPHWYVVRKYCRNDDEWLAFMRLIRRWGYDDYFFKTKIRYLDLDGYKYWTNGYSELHTDIINRAELKEDTYPNPWVLNPTELKIKPWYRGFAVKAGGEDYINSPNYKVVAVRTRVRIKNENSDSGSSV